MKLVYIAGPYGASGPYDVISRNVSVARMAAVALRERGIGFYCPHTHTEHFEVYKGDDEFFAELHDTFVPFCHAMLMLPGWKGSKGSKHERNIAEELNFSIYEAVLLKDGTLYVPELLFLDYEEGRW